MKKIALFAATLVLAGAGCFLWPSPPPPTPVPQPAPAPAPQPAPDPNGPEAKQNLIRVTTPQPGDLVSSPLTVMGEARGTWYFEASFPIRLYDADGKELAVAVAQAQGDWMTENFVPFKATLKFDKPATATGTLVLQKDNPSGLPENDDQLRIAVRFGGAAALPSPGAPCRKTGCSSQVCADEDVMTTCEYREEYVCYQDAVCERQPSGECDWTPTPELGRCLSEKTVKPL